ncbi:MAG: hypothetical protein N4A74_13605 [Carboxylicivirga sp.]|jgi:hypothetical protein|nr:hypothetical protein [Carboxylicivirga sp.]
MKVDKDIQIAELLSKQLLGELSESERNTVDAWMCDESNKALYHSIRQDILKGAYKHQTLHEGCCYYCNDSHHRNFIVFSVAK